MVDAHQLSLQKIIIRDNHKGFRQTGLSWIDSVSEIAKILRFNIYMPHLYNMLVYKASAICFYHLGSSLDQE